MNKGNNSGSDRPANLLNNSVSYDQLREKSKFPDVGVKEIGNNEKNVMDEIMKNLDTKPTTETDMLFQYMANAEKLVDKDNLQFFEKSYSSNRGGGGGTQSFNSKVDTDKSRNNTENINDYVSGQNNDYNYNSYNNSNNSNNDHQLPKGSAYGPSYGDGQTFVADEGSMQADPYHGFGSEDELNIAKLNMLRQLGELTQHGVKLSQNYSMKSDYKAMKYEYELHKSIRDKHNGTRWLSNLMLNVCWGVELANENFNPFEFKLKGWSEQMNDDIDEYYDVLGELYEKYFKSGRSIPPELKLVMMIGGSAVKFHIAHTALGKIPTLSEALQKNPALAKKLNEQAVSEKVKEKYEKQKETFDKKSNEQHELAKKQAADLVMLKQKELEFAKMQQEAQSKENQEIMQQQMMQQQFLQQQMMQQQIMQQQLLGKQKQLEDLQKQLTNQRSDTRSTLSRDSNNSSSKKKSSQNNYISQPTMKMPTVPASLRNRYTNMGGGQIITSNDNRDNVSIDPEVDNLINSGFDTRSHVSDNSNNSKASNVSKRSRKKPTIKINTK